MKGKRVSKKEGKSRSTALANVSDRAPVSVDALAMIPEEAVWLASRKSARTRRAYRTDVQHFMAYVGITSAAELRRVDHRAVMAYFTECHIKNRVDKPPHKCLCNKV